MNLLNDMKNLIDDNVVLLGIEKTQREVWLENGKFRAGSNKENEQGFHILDMEYRLNLAVKNIGNEEGSLLVLLVHQFARPMEQKDLEGVTYSITSNDEKSINLNFSLGVREPVYVVPVENSPIRFGGKQWGFGDGSLNIAKVLADVATQRTP